MSDRQLILELRNVHFSYTQGHSIGRRRKYPAIRGVSLKVFRGETVGIIGRNGCGKSTLLRLIAGIYRPDAGHIDRHCSRISMLSLALGFDPQLSGRENAVLSGMLSGSSRQQVEAELDEIMRFADLGSFANEPIKTYSTGMRARLGFAVALKLRTDLMLLDEILSVGDVRFRSKAEAAMSDRINSDQTVIMVSHSIPQLRNFCDKVVWLGKGEVLAIGDPEAVTAQYEAEQNQG